MNNTKLSLKCRINWYKAIFAIIGIMFVASVQAQSKPNRNTNREQIKAAKVAFITNRLDLNSETAQVFWPIYNAYEKERSQLTREYYEIKRKYAKDRDHSSLSETDAEFLLEKYLAQKEAEANIEKKYLPKFKGVLTAQQTWMLITAEVEFRRTLMQRLSRSRQGGKPNQDAQKKKGN